MRSPMQCIIGNKYMTYITKEELLRILGKYELTHRGMKITEKDLPAFIEVETVER